MARRQDTDDSGKGAATDADEDSPGLDRRDYLKLAGSATVVTAAGAVNASAATERHGISFDNVVHAVDDLGMDPNDGERIDGALSGVAPNTLVEFPNGTYKIDGAVWFEGDGANYGLVGTGDDVTLKPVDGKNDWIIQAFCSKFLFENIDVDQRVDGTLAGMRLYPQNGFHVENVEWLGRGWPGSYSRWNDEGEVNMYAAGVQNSGGVGVFKNVVAKKISKFGDAYPSSSRRSRVGIWAGRNHKGTIRILNCDFRESPNNALYMSRCPGYVQVEDSYFENNNVASVRISGDESWMKNCTVVADVQNISAHRDLDTDGINIRGFLHEQKPYENKSGPVLVENCTFEWRSLKGIGSQGAIHTGPSGRNVHVRNCHVDIHTDGVQAVLRRARSERGMDTPKPLWTRIDGLTVTGSASGGNAVELREADGSYVRNCCISQGGSDRDGVRIRNSRNCVVEDSAIEVTGQAVNLDGSSADTSNVTNDASCSGDGPSFLPNVLTIHGDQGPANYEFTVSGDLEHSTDDGASIDDGDVVEGSTATGFVNGGTDSYRFDGELTDLQLSDPATVLRNGEPIDPASFGSDSESTDLPNVLTIHGDQGPADYEFTVSGQLEHSTDNGGTIDEEDGIEGSTATGFVYGGTDSYRFDGELTDLQLTDPATVLRNGTEVDPAQFGGKSASVITIRGDHGPANYAFTVSGDLEHSTDNGASIDDTDEITDSTAQGFVDGGADSYRFTGEVTDFRTDAQVSVSIDGQTLDPSQFAADLPHRLVIEGGSDDVRTTYKVAVSGDLSKGAYADPDDEVDGNVATGVLDGGTDDFRFSGAVTRLNVDGDANVAFDEDA